MNEENNQIPIIKFLKKHKWRLILPALVITLFISIPLVMVDWTAISQNLFIKSATLDKNGLTVEVTSKIQYVQSDEFLKGLIVKYDLFSGEKDEKTKIEKLRKSIDVSFDKEDLIEGVSLNLYTRFKDKKGGEFIAEISNEIAAKFEQNQNWHIDKYVTKPYYPLIESKIERLITNIFMSMLMFSVPLILLWEIPNIFYSPKTKKMIFEPLKADWQAELYEAKLGKQMWKVFEINIRYSFAFIAVMIQKSPVGSLLEHFGNFAK